MPSFSYEEMLAVTHLDSLERVSGPILDRIDLFAIVSQVDHKKLLTTIPPQADNETAIRERIQAARKTHLEHFKSPQKLNADVSNRDIKQWALLSPTAKELIDTVAARLTISARAYMRTVKVVRTITDLTGSSSIEPEHITEALQYRNHSFQTIS